jgi:hypothetical protein
MPEAKLFFLEGIRFLGYGRNSSILLYRIPKVPPIKGTFHSELSARTILINSSNPEGSAFGVISH